MQNYFRRNLLAGVGLLLMALWLVLFTGCGGNSNIKQARQTVQEVYEIQKPIEVRTSLSDKRPAWIHKSMFEDEGNLYFSGGYMNGSDYSVTIRCANAEALKSAIQSISQFIRSEFSMYAHGPNTGADGIDRYVSDGIATVTRSLHLQGIKQKEIYYEEMFSPYVMQPTFNIWVQLEISKAEYLKAKADAVRQLRNRFASAGKVEAKKKAENLLNDLKREIHEEAILGT